MTTHLRPGALIGALLGLTTFLAAAEPTPAEVAAKTAEYRKLVQSLKPQAGEVALAGGVAKATLPENLRYLNPADTATVLTKLWGNPAGAKTLGMLVPASFDPFSDDSWAVVVTFEEDGYVKDDDAAKIDYTKLLAEMKEDTREGSKERVKAGYAPIELVGWASPPRYDAVTKKLYWAKELKFGDSPSHTLNYNIRMLGRRGVLVLNAVAGMEQLKLVEQATPTILQAVEFQAGHRYADFNASTDKTATYGLAALVAGGVAAKAGFFKMLWVGILAFKKFIIIALVAGVGFVPKLWAWIRGRQPAQSSTAGGDSNPPAA